MSSFVSIRPLCWLILPLCVMACSVDTGIAQRPRNDSDDDSAARLDVYPALAFKADYVEALCGWFGRCASTVGNVFGDAAGCRAFMDFAFELEGGEGGLLTEPLLYRVDSVKADECLRSIEARACATSVPTFGAQPACVAAFVGRLSDGECCDRRGGCAPGLVCEMGDPENPELGYCTAIGDAGETCRVQACAAPATCENVGGTVPQCVVSLALGVGEPCGHTFDCAPTLSCQWLAGAESMRCLPRAGVGDICSRPEIPCGAGLYCVGDGWIRACATAPGVEGQGCEAEGDCGPGLSCVPSDTGSRMCVHLGALGEPCSEIFGERCEEAITCIDGRCAPVPVPVTFGDRCIPNGPPCPGTLFDSDAACQPDGAGYFCVAPLGLNAPCSNDNQCDFGQGLACFSDTATCRKLPVRGEACPGGQCYPLFTVTCAAGVCADRKPVGSACTPFPDELDDFFDTECAFLSACLPDAATGATICTSLLGNGQGGVQCQ